MALQSLLMDPRTNAFTAAYDWRLSCEKLELRDSYFTRLKAHIELAKKMSGEKVVLVSHSMGSQVLFYFFNWVEADSGPGWVDDYVDSCKAMSRAILS